MRRNKQYLRVCSDEGDAKTIGMCLFGRRGSGTFRLVTERRGFLSILAKRLHFRLAEETHKMAMQRESVRSTGRDGTSQDKCPGKQDKRIFCKDGMLLV